MVRGSENRIAKFIEVKVRLSRPVQRDESPGFLEDCPKVVSILGKPRERFQAGPAKTGGLVGIFREPTQERLGNNDLLAPTRPFVEFALCDPAAIVPLA
jgi:hypothetical protein